MNKGFKFSPNTRKQSYNDIFSGAEDYNLRKLLYSTDDSNSDSIRRLKRALAGVIQNDLTERQQEYVEYYYGDCMGQKEIAQMYGVSQQAVSAVLMRAKRRLYRTLKYYF